jgi:hypothetical protein
LPEQALGRKRIRSSSANFNWLSVLAAVEVQLVLRCLDFRSRLAAARCNKQLLTAASHPFAWPQEQLTALRVENVTSALQSLGARVRGSLLRLSSIDLRVRFWNGILWPLCSELFAVPNVHAIKVQPPEVSSPVVSDVLLPLLLHPAAQQLRSLDVPFLRNYTCSPAQLQHLVTLSRLQSLSLGAALSVHFPPSLPQSSVIFPSLTHLSLYQPDSERAHPRFPLSRCPRLTSLKLDDLAFSTELFSSLAQLPLLQRLQLRYGFLHKPATNAWTALRSLREIEFDYMRVGPPLLSMLRSIPALRLLRWRCRVPQSAVCPYLPTLPTLRELTTAAPQLQVELVMRRSFDEWRTEAFDSNDAALLALQRRCWDEMQQLVLQPELRGGVRVIEVESENDD